MAKEPEDWKITINGSNGFCPSFIDNAYPFFGNKNQASAMKDINLLDPNVITQGFGVVALTAGTQAGAVTTLIKGILKTCTSSDVSFAVGGAKLYQFSATAVANATIWPHTIDKGTVTGEDGEDVCYYKTNLYYSYNHSGSAGDVGKYDMATTFDDDYMSTTPTNFAALQNAPHQMIVGGDDVMYIANGMYIAYLDGTTFEPQGLDFFTDSQVASIAWNNNRVIAAVNRPNVTGSNFNQSAIYNWNGVSTSWEGDPIEVNGRIGALYTKNGVTFVWWQDNNSSNVFGYISGAQLVPLKRFAGTLPLYYQVGEYKGNIIWFTGGLVYAWGAGDIENPNIFYQIMSSTHATSGGIASPFGLIMVASNLTTSFELAKQSGYSILSTYKTVAFDMSGSDFIAQLELITVQTEQLSTGAKCDFTLTYNQGKTTLALTQIAYSADNVTRHKIFDSGVQVEDMRIDLSWANGSASNPCKIRSIKLQGKYIKSN
jgi:hypothetical protein